MYKNITYKEKFAILKSWMPYILESVKKDLKNEHLKKDWNFTKKYFATKNHNKLSSEEMADAYHNEIMTGENGEELAEFVSNRWLLKNSEVYHFFENELSKINPNFNEIDELDKVQSQKMMQEAVKQFNAPRTYLFCVMNSVVFPDEIFKELGAQAQKEIDQEAIQNKVLKEKVSFEELKNDYEQQLSRMADKYEKKLLGLQKKYIQDTEVLKKQITGLQRKLNPQTQG